MCPLSVESEKDVGVIPVSDSRPAEWLHVIPHLDPRYGGLSAAVPQLASAVAAYSGRDVGIAAFCTDDEGETDAQYPDLTISRWPASRTAWFKERALQNRFQTQIDTASTVHVHGLWEHSTTVAASTSRLLNKPYILSAHGMLDRWALSNKGLKKAIYAALIERTNVSRASCLHALTESEVGDYRRFGATQPVVVIPNGVSIPRSIDAGAFLDLFPRLRGKRIVLFLSRIHYKKGLDVLVEAWRDVSAANPDAHLVLAGPDFENTRQRIQNSIDIHGLADSVLFAGMLDQRLKWSALAAAECFVLPSYSEGLSVAILEAMGCGVPVIITEQCNLPEVGRSAAGWTVQPTSEQIGSALSEMLSNSEAVNRSIGENGRQLVERNYSWPLIARKMSEVYSWLEGGASPLSVELIGH